MEFCLFLGCNTPAVRPDVERAIRCSMESLGVDMVDADNYVCCPAFGSFPSTDIDSWLATSAWNLSIAEEKKRDLLVQCGSCYSSLRMGREHILEHEPWCNVRRVSYFLKKCLNSDGKVEKDMIRNIKRHNQ